MVTLEVRKNLHKGKRFKFSYRWHCCYRFSVNLMFLAPPRPYKKTSLGEEKVTGGSGGASGNDLDAKRLEHGPRPQASPSWCKSTNSYRALKNTGLECKRIDHITIDSLQFPYTESWILKYKIIFQLSSSTNKGKKLIWKSHNTHFSAVPCVNFNSNVKESPLDKKLSVLAHALDRLNNACSQVLGARSRQNLAMRVAFVGGRPTITDWAEVALDIWTDRSLSLQVKVSSQTKYNLKRH